MLQLIFTMRYLEWGSQYKTFLHYCMLHCGLSSFFGNPQFALYLLLVRWRETQRLAKTYRDSLLTHPAHQTLAPIQWQACFSYLSHAVKRAQLHVCVCVCVCWDIKSHSLSMFCSKRVSASPGWAGLKSAAQWPEAACLHRTAGGAVTSARGLAREEERKA